MTAVTASKTTLETAISTTLPEPESAEPDPYAEQAPLDEQVWHTYPPVRMPSVEGVVGALTRPETWPDYASELGRFTRMAVERFQRDHGLEVTGRVDAATAERLRQEHGA